MKACSLCDRVLPETSFRADRMTRTQLSSWCIDCYRKKQAEWRRASPHNRKAWTEEARITGVDPIQWAGSHCRHISDYVTKVVARFESRTGQEAPPQLIAIRQIADEMSGQLPERQRATKGGHIVCRNCGREFFPLPQGRGWAAYCSSYCKDRFKQVAEVMDGKRPSKLEREQAQERNRKRRETEKDATRARRAERQPRAYERAAKALELRQAGRQWNEIAAELGYSAPAGPWLAIKQTLKIDPKTIRVSAGKGADK